jgi:amino-acid N-acetyltransferase
LLRAGVTPGEIDAAPEGGLIAMKISARPTLAGATALLAAARLPIEDLTPEHCEHFFFAGPESAPDGLVGLELFGDVALLRSLVVAESRRGAGTGSALLDHAEAYARSRGVRRLYLLTTTAEPFFARHGFGRAERQAAPPAIRATREFSGICPSSSAFMEKQL